MAHGNTVASPSHRHTGAHKIWGYCLEILVVVGSKSMWWGYGSGTAKVLPSHTPPRGGQELLACICVNVKERKFAHFRDLLVWYFSNTLQQI